MYRRSVMSIVGVRPPFRRIICSDRLCASLISNRLPLMLTAGDSIAAIAPLPSTISIIANHLAVPPDDRGGTTIPLIDSPALTKALPSSSPRSEEHTSELQSLRHLVCRLLLE